MSKIQLTKKMEQYDLRKYFFSCKTKIEQFTSQEAKRRQRGSQGTRNEERTESESG